MSRSKRSAIIDRQVGQNDVLPVGEVPAPLQSVEQPNVTTTCPVTITTEPAYDPRFVVIASGLGSMFSPVKTINAKKPSGGEGAGTGSGGGKKFDLYGHSAAAVLRWLGSKGIKAKTAAQVLVRAGLSGVSPATVSTQVQLGRKCPLEKIPTLTDDQASALLAPLA